MLPSNVVRPSIELPPSLDEALAREGLQVEGMLGQGGSALVYRARDTRHDRAVAVKVLRPDVVTAEAAERFAREIATVARLRHPNILPLYDSGTTADGLRWFVMPLLEGRSLRALMAAGPLPLGEVVRLVGEIAEALAVAHVSGVVHRDVKPENVLIDNGHAVVTDFGLVRPVPSSTDATPGEAPIDERLTAASVVVGTTEYMSPEQAAGDPAIDVRSDEYSLACVAYEMIAGRSPFAGGTPREVLARRFREEPAALTTVRPDLPEAVDGVIRRALAVDPGDRYPDVGAFADALRDAAASVISSGSATRPAGAPRRVRRRRALLAAGLVAVAGSVVVLATRAPRAAPVVLDPSRIVVAGLSNETGDTALDPPGQLVTEELRAGLAREGRHVVTSAVVVPALHDARRAGAGLDDPERIGALAQEARAATVIAGSYYLVAGDRLEFLLEITDARSGELRRTLGPVRAEAGRADSIAALLRGELTATLDTLLGASRPRHAQARRAK